MSKLRHLAALTLALLAPAAFAGTPVLNSTTTDAGRAEFLATGYGSALVVQGSNAPELGVDALAMARVGLSSRTDLGVSMGTDGVVFSTRWRGNPAEAAGFNWSLVPSIGGSINRRPDAPARGAGITAAIRGTLGVGMGRGEWLVSSEVELWHVQRAQLTNRFTRFGVDTTVGYSARLWGPTQLMPWVQGQYYRAHLQLNRQPTRYTITGIAGGLTLIVGR